MDGKSNSSIRPGLKLPGGYVLLESIGKGKIVDLLCLFFSLLFLSHSTERVIKSE